MVGMENAYLAVDDFVDKLLGLVDTVGNLCRKYGLAVETRGLNVLVSRNDDTVAVCYLLSGKNVLCAAGAVCFYLDSDAHLVARLGKSLSSHIGVSDTCRAGCNRQNAVAFLLLRRGSSRFLGELLCFLVVDDLQEFFGSLCRLELCGKVLVHEHLHKTRQNLEMYVSVEGSSYHEDELAGSAVGRLVVNAAGHCYSRKSGSLYSLAFGVRNSDFHADSGSSHVLSGKDTVLVRRGINKIAALFMQRHKNVDCLSLSLGSNAERDTLFFKQVGDTHKLTSLYKELFYLTNCSAKLFFKFFQQFVDFFFSSQARKERRSVAAYAAQLKRVGVISGLFVACHKARYH